MSQHIDQRMGLRLGSGTILLLALMMGCTRSSDDKPNDGKKLEVQVEEKKDNAGKTITGQPVARARDTKLLSFEEAVKQGIILTDPPMDELPPPDVICNGKVSGKLFEAITTELWDKIVFNDEAGRRIKYEAILSTELGEIHIDLLGDIAPYHVRNFVSLARSGYFDNMKFYYSLNTKIQDQVAAYIETGCPRGTGEIGSGSIGYWLAPEINQKITHDEGMVGACLNGDPNTAASRFYITAARMPQLDGDFTVFGKVTQGLDIVRTINTREVHKEIENLNRLKEPVLIRNVSIRTFLAES